MIDPISLNLEMMLVLGLLAITIILFAFEILRVDVAAICIMVLSYTKSIAPTATYRCLHAFPVRPTFEIGVFQETRP